MVVCARPSFIMLVKNFGGPPQKNFRGQKHAKFRSLPANISETDEDIQNRINILSTVIPPALDDTSFGPLITEISMWNHTETHPNRLFLMIIFRSLVGAAPPDFYMCHIMTKSC